jgi:uncharacterized tellurite resistance protein B-like protein
MIDLVKKFFDKPHQGRPVRQGKERLHDIRVATCALFLEMAAIDGEFSDLERERIVSILKKDFDLSDEYAVELLDAANAELKKSIDLWQFTNLINENYSIEEKTRIIAMVWKIVYTDGKLDMHEDYLAHKLAKLLRLTHKQLVDAKLRILHGDEVT